MRAIRSLAALPPFPPTLARLLAGLAQEDMPFSKIAGMIEQDTVLAANVLRLVNSGLYGRRGTVNSVGHAVSLLGVNKIRNAALGMSVSGFWDQVRTPYGWSTAKFNLHSFGTAALADVFSQSGPAEYPEGAFAAGLFHDLGRLLIAIALPEQHFQISVVMSGGHFSRSDCEMEALGFTHAQLAAEALEQWNLPKQIQVAVLHHHEPESAPRVASRIPLSALVAAADECLNALGYVVENEVVPIEQALDRFNSLKLARPLPPLLKSFAADFEVMRSIM